MRAESGITEHETYKSVEKLVETSYKGCID